MSSTGSKTRTKDTERETKMKTQLIEKWTREAAEALVKSLKATGGMKAVLLARYNRLRAAVRGMGREGDRASDPTRHLTPPTELLNLIETHLPVYDSEEEAEELWKE